jgi:hypothetical protein
VTPPAYGIAPTPWRDEARGAVGMAIRSIVAVRASPVAAFG